MCQPNSLDTIHFIYLLKNNLQPKQNIMKKYAQRGHIVPGQELLGEMKKF